MSFNRFDDSASQHIKLQLPDQPKGGSVKEPKYTKPANKVPKQNTKKAGKSKQTKVDKDNPFERKPLNWVGPWDPSQGRHRPGREAKGAPQKTSAGPTGRRNQSPSASTIGR